MWVILVKEMSSPLIILRQDELLSKVSGRLCWGANDSSINAIPEAPEFMNE